VSENASSKADDDYLWLEEVEGEQALEWVEEQNALTLAELASDPVFEVFQHEALRILEADDKLPFGVIRGDHVYNFWQDANHVRGLWRRATLADYRSDQTNWQVLIDVDRLAADEDENWVWQGASLTADYTKAMVSLSRGGKDASVVREFDVASESFVSDGFELPEAKSAVAWVDHDTLLVGTDFGPGTVTSSGYPATTRRWRRGRPLAEAELLHSVPEHYVALWPLVQNRPEGQYACLSASPDFFTEEITLIADDGSLRPLDLPADVDLRAFFERRALAVLRSPWRGAGQGALVAVDLESDRVEVLYQPDDRSSVAMVATSRDAVVFTTLENVAGALYVARLDGGDNGADGGWRVEKVEMDGLGSVDLISVPDDRSDLFVSYNDHLTPPSLLMVELGAGDNPAEVEVVKRQPARFDAGGLAVTQLWATSADGTEIPYFLIGPAQAVSGGDPASEPDSTPAPAPVLLYGYGGFEVPLAPGYAAVVGKLWLERGGLYAVANIRGGGEFGPSWHQAALKTNRHRAYEDFEAVAEDLIARGITSPERLGIMGGSNGGLLVGSAFIRRPELYKAVICAVPLLDMLRFHELLAGASWIGEYGDPYDPEIHGYWSTHSPFHRVSVDAEYPEVFFLTSTRDDRVHPGHARKMVARMLDQGHPIHYFENTEGGHSAAANLKQQARLSALEYVYLRRMLMSSSIE
jgi:prolyl oligopeptidase